MAPSLGPAIRGHGIPEAMARLHEERVPPSGALPQGHFWKTLRSR